MKEVTMSPRKKTMAILASVLAGALAIGAAVALPARMAHHGGSFGKPGFGGGIARALASLDLTDEQKAQVKAILKDEEPRVEPLMDDMLRSKKALFDAVHARTFDEKAVRSAASSSARATTELSVERARMVSRLRDLLTDEQQERLETIHRQFEERLENRVGLACTIWKEQAADFIDAL
jgi:Spy/CpxP family protein refolding chaperone